MKRSSSNHRAVHIPFLRGGTSILAILGLGTTLALGWTPGTGSPTAVQGFVVDTTNRRDVLAFYNTVYTASENYAANLNWTGDVQTGVAGTTGATFKDDVRRRVNFYRALVGLPGDIVFDATKSAKCQQAALMMSANDDLNHFPPVSWTYYTADGYQAAGASNLALGSYGPEAINQYMQDLGSGNELVGHRRWILYSRSQSMGTGDIPTDGAAPPTNALWVTTDPKAAPAPQFLPWPNRGYHPFPLVPSRWSLGYPGANFAGASVTMTQGAANVPVTIISNAVNGVGDNTLVWVPTGLPSSVTSDVPYTVNVTGISGAGVPTSYNYTVTLFNPLVLGESATITGSATPPIAGSTYTFNSIAQADAYELSVATASTAAWTEGAEASPTPKILAETGTTYTIPQSFFAASGTRSFHLTFPTGVFIDQGFQVTRDIIPTSTSKLQFSDRCRFAATTTTMRAEVTTNGGATWTSVFSRNGVGLSSSLFDPAFIARDISLSAYAGQLIRVRFVIKGNGSGVVQGISNNDGFFVDNITITNATELANPTVTALAGNATSFSLNSTTAGAALVVGTTYHLRIRPNVGTLWFDYGSSKAVTAQANPTGYAGWIVTQYPTVTGGPAGDHDKDGIRNGVEYAFNLNPLLPTPAASIPQPTIVGGNLSMSYTPPVGATGVTYGAQWSTDLNTWNPITAVNAGGVLTYSVSTSGKTKLFFRHNLVMNP